MMTNDVAEGTLAIMLKHLEKSIDWDSFNKDLSLEIDSVIILQDRMNGQKACKERNRHGYRHS